MDVFEAILTRRSIRKYTGEPVSEADLRTVLRAAFYAPSARNRQPREFVVVRKPATLQAIADGHPFGKMLPAAGCCILVCGDRSIQTKTGSLVEDCSASIENMLLAAHGLGLGAVWCGLYPVPKRTRQVAGLLGLPKDLVPVGMIALGHKAEERQVDERFNPGKVHYEKW